MSVRHARGALLSIGGGDISPIGVVAPAPQNLTAWPNGRVAGDFLMLWDTSYFDAPIATWQDYHRGTQDRLMYRIADGNAADHAQQSSAGNEDVFANFRGVDPVSPIAGSVLKPSASYTNGNFTVPSFSFSGSGGYLLVLVTAFVSPNSVDLLDTGGLTELTAGGARLTHLLGMATTQNPTPAITMRSDVNARQPMAAAWMLNAA